MVRHTRASILAPSSPRFAWKVPWISNTEIRSASIRFFSVNVLVGMTAFTGIPVCRIQKNNKNIRFKEAQGEAGALNEPPKDPQHRGKRLDLNIKENPKEVFIRGFSPRILRFLPTNPDITLKTIWKFPLCVPGTGTSSYIHHTLKQFQSQSRFKLWSHFRSRLSKFWKKKAWSKGDFYGPRFLYTNLGEYRCDK